MAFKRDAAYEEQGKFIAWIFWTVVWSLLACWVLALLMPALSLWIKEGISFNTLSEACAFWKDAIGINFLPLIKMYVSWFSSFFSQPEVAGHMYLVWMPFVALIGIFLVGVFTNPYKYMPNVFGGGREAEYADIKKMGLFDGFVIVLGRFKGKLLKMPETLSALVVAPPGTGKTAGVVIPTILESPGLSLIVNDPKPELCYKHRSNCCTIPCCIVT